MPEQYSVPQVGPWAEVKLSILEEYTKAYSTIFKKHSYLTPIYIDAFAGSGQAIERKTFSSVRGSPLRVLDLAGPFKEYYFIDENPANIEVLSHQVGQNDKVKLIVGDANQELPKILKSVTRSSKRRALLFLDPFKLNVDWEIMQLAGELKSVDFFLNFMTMDLERNVLRRNPTATNPDDGKRFDRMFGSDEWRRIGYSTVQTLFEDEEYLKQPVEKVIEAYRERLRDKAGFEFVPKPVPILNTKKVTIYHLFFGSQVKAGENIARWVMNKYLKYQVKDV